MIIRSAVLMTLLALAVTAFSVPPASAKSGGDLVKVERDIDVYVQPGGVGEPVGVLRKKSEVELITKRKDHWCNVQGAAVPTSGNIGWVWCGIGDDKQDYRLKPVVAETPAPTGGGSNGAGGGGGDAAEPIKSDCKIIGPNEGAGGGSKDPKVTFKCVDIGDDKKECCFYTQP